MDLPSCYSISLEESQSYDVADMVVIPVHRNSVLTWNQHGRICMSKGQALFTKGFNQIKKFTRHV